MTSHSETQVRSALDAITARYTDANPGNDYTYILQLYARPYDGSNWSVGAVGRSLSPPGTLSQLDAEMNAVRKAMPIIA